MVTNDVRIHLASASSWIEPVALRVEGLVQGRETTLELSTTDRRGGAWRAWARFAVGATGTIDPARDRPLDGTYDGVDDMGLFWSMRPAQAGAAYFERGDIARASYLLRVLDGGHELARAEHHRVSVATATERSRLDGPVTGVRYRLHGAQPRSAVLVLGGSEGGIPDDFAAAFASAGYNALGLAYFGAGTYGRDLVEVPVERVFAGIDLLARDPLVDPARIVLFGRSKGAELALLAAASRPDLAGVISMLGSGLAWFGLDFGVAQETRQRSSWSQGGHAVPFVASSAAANAALGVAYHAGEPMRYRSVYDASLAAAEDAGAAARIPVERIVSPLLVLSADNDEVWDSRMLADDIIGRRQAVGRADDRHTWYVCAGHGIGLPHQPTYGWNSIDTGRSRIALGGSPAGYAYANRDAWRIVERYLRERFDAAPRHDGCEGRS